MDIEKNTTYACHAVRINGEEVDYLSALVVDEECIIRITIKEVERKIYDKVRNAPFVNVVVKYEAIYITVAECQLVKRSFRIASDSNESKIDLEYMSSLMLLDYLWPPSQEIRFSGINCEITETTELLGVYPYQIDYGELTFPRVECDIKGEIITIEDVYLRHGEHSIKTVGLCNFPKNKLNALQSNFDTRSYLRKSIFKISDFEDGIGSAITAFYEIQNECMLACEAYKQILLDEEIKISTYNKFLKVMQVVEGFQRAKINESEEIAVFMSWNENIYIREIWCIKAAWTFFTQQQIQLNFIHQ